MFENKTASFPTPMHIVSLAQCPEYDCHNQICHILDFLQWPPSLSHYMMEARLIHHCTSGQDSLGGTPASASET